MMTDNLQLQLTAQILFLWKTNRDQADEEAGLSNSKSSG
jgi:hypothetical protein